MDTDIDYEEFIGEKLVSVRGIERQMSREGRLSYYLLIFEFSSASLLFQTNNDTDEIIVRRRSRAKFARWPNVSELNYLLNLKTIYSWMGYNHNGNCDMFVFSFEDAKPTLALHVLASLIHIFDIRSVVADIGPTDGK